MTNKHLIQASISQMDTEKLKQLLSDKYLYSEWDKENFVATLEVAAFSAFRENGDTFLNPYKGSCKCCEEKGYKGIAFIGNKSKDVLNIVFEENELDVTDIFSCGSFKTHEKVDTNYIQCIPTLTDSSSEIPF